MSEYPEIFRIRQKFDRPVIEDVAGEVESQLARLNLGGSIQPGQSVAISAGSRGIANIHIIIKSIVDHLKGLGAEPFIVPAMGSHGGATAQGQQGIVEGYGITEAFCGCPIRSSMETVIVCDAQEGFPVHFDKNAYGADHVLVCGRVKPHTSYVGDIESGLMKMMLIGLGKYEGAKTYHRAIKDFSFAQIIRSVAREVLAKCRIVAGLAVVENGYDETAKIQAVAPDEFEEREKELLVLAKQWMPRLPFKQADLLMVDKIGKNISGSGMDSNVVGRKYLDHRAGEEEWPKIRTIFLRGLTEETHGNATGIGMAEFALTRAVDAMDVAVTRRNCITGGSPTAAMVPLHYASDREVLEVTLPEMGLTAISDTKVMWIHNTLEVSELECSRAYLDEARESNEIEILTDPRPLPLDKNGNLPNVTEVGA
ncbi:MAG TPA: lactate racemase domain-containing protein [Arenicellales bacterium]|jgi:hypothetical protein|nr:lactate racemase domain-containing protein [Arenicellales bacterium]HJP11477.1 lactate racemase domain-containing protein [Arenicellales bacterium]|tara:strand:- start:3106 stop:4380 length:1275 start_codon:yes stop_codon:yes gene_type:complete